MSPTQKQCPLRGLAAGLLGGAAASLVLDLFHTASLKGTQAFEDATGLPPTLSGQQQAQLLGYQYAQAEIASRLSQLVTGKNLLREQRAQAAPYVHYGLGALAGALYGLLAEYLPSVTTGHGTAYGALLYLGGPETALPAFELSPSPRKIPPAMHVGGLAAHIVYGAALETARRLTRRLF